MRAVAARRNAVRSPEDEFAGDDPARHQGHQARQTSDGVALDVQAADGRSETLTGTFIIGADGIGSVVRKAVGAQFDGITIPELFLTLSTTYDFRDVYRIIGTRHFDTCQIRDEWYVLDPHREACGARCSQSMPRSTARTMTSQPERSKRLLQRRSTAHASPYEVTHCTAYQVHERVASTYVNSDASMIAGDAAHREQSMLGGDQGRNSGVHPPPRASSRPVN